MVDVKFHSFALRDPEKGGQLFRMIQSGMRWYRFTRETPSEWEVKKVAGSWRSDPLGYIVDEDHDGRFHPSGWTIALEDFDDAVSIEIEVQDWRNSCIAARDKLRRFEKRVTVALPIAFVVGVLIGAAVIFLLLKR